MSRLARWARAFANWISPPPTPLHPLFAELDAAIEKVLDRGHEPTVIVVDFETRHELWAAMAELAVVPTGFVHGTYTRTMPIVYQGFNVITLEDALTSGSNLPPLWYRVIMVGYRHG